MVVLFMLRTWNIIRAGEEPGRGPIGTEQQSRSCITENIA